MKMAGTKTALKNRFPTPIGNAKALAEKSAGALCVASAARGFVCVEAHPPSLGK